MIVDARELQFHRSEYC